ncbi:MAG: type II toxin-antitoxin system RelE/ParE family toxin [Deltaproteobacteria bacterium]|nr:type II toxin-antitoxin system RelE/ParE family toxin [Deltaproteobacteria bacterium]
MYKIDLPKRVSKQLDKVPNKDYSSVSTAIKSLEQTPRPSGCKKLYESLYRIRIGDFRVVYWIDDRNRTIIITKVERRKERTYKHL